MRPRTATSRAAVAMAAVVLTGCSINVGTSTSSPTPTDERAAFCASWTGAQQSVQDAQQALEDGNPLALPGALSSLQSNLTQLGESLPSDAPTEVQRALEGVGSRVSDAVSRALENPQDLERAAREIRAIPSDLRSVNEYATSIC